MHLRMGMRVGKLSATSRLPACRTTWQLFPRTVPKLLLFLPSIVNMLPIFPGEGTFSPANLRPTQHFRSPLPRPHMSPPPRLPRAQALHPRCRLHSPQTPSPGRLHAPRTLAPASAPSTCASPTRRPSLVCVLRYLAFSALFHPKFPENAAHRTATATGGGREENETPATGERMRVRCRQVSVDKHKTKTRGCVLQYRAKQGSGRA